MILTDIFRLRKPEGTDPVNIQDFNDNFDVIETELNNRPTKTGIASDMTTNFTKADSRTNLLSGEKLATSLGKIMRWFGDLTTVAFSGKYSDLAGTPSLGSSASAVVIESTEDLAAVTEEGYVVGGIAGAELIKNLSDFQSSFQDGCSTIAAAITEMGVATADNASPETMAANIKALIKPATYLGWWTLNGNTETFDVASATDKYTTLVLWENLFPCIEGGFRTSSGNAKTVSYNYDASSGILTATGSIGDSDKLDIKVYAII